MLVTFIVLNEDIFTVVKEEHLLNILSMLVVFLY